MLDAIAPRSINRLSRRLLIERPVLWREPNRKTRKGTPCQMKPFPGRRRCRLHGGLSTGPKTAEGREAIGRAPKARWEAVRERLAELPANTHGSYLSGAGLGNGKSLASDDTCFCGSWCERQIDDQGSPAIRFHLERI